MYNNRNLPYYPTVSWSSRKNERWSSKIHYEGDRGRTLCGLKIPRNRDAGDSWDMCERCVQIRESKDSR